MKERILAMAFLAVVFSACSPKYTASFGPSQKFYKSEKSQIPNALSEVTDRQKVITQNTPEKQVVASASTSPKHVPPIASTSTRTEKIVEKYTKNELPSVKKVLKLPAKERKKVLKEVKKDIKALKKAKKNNSIENKKVYAGIIIALAGLVIAILASGPIGALGIIVGVCLIAWGLIEEGNF